MEQSLIFIMNYDDSRGLVPEEVCDLKDCGVTGLLEGRG